MFSTRSTVAMILSVALFVPPIFASHVHRAPTSGRSKAATKSKSQSTAKARSKSHSTAATKTDISSHKTHKGSKRKTVSRVRGQRSIDSERATQIQQALIREHYLTGEPSGSWDAASISAMQKYQSEQGWQTKIMPDSRALKKLGLGPDYSSAINAKVGSFAPPQPDDTIPTEQASGFAAAAGVTQ